MRYNFTSDGIEIIGKSEFNPKHILECGQIFRFFVNDKGNYEVFSLDKKAEIEETEDGYKVLTSDQEYFENFFDLKTDYNKIKKQIAKKLPFMEDIISHSEGLRILKQDPFEMIVSFIISANNNIKRIKLIIDKLCVSSGEDMGGYHAFPKEEIFFALDKEFFVGIGAGYRASYLSELKNALKLLDKEVLGAMSTITLRKKLMEIKGVGPKVADCILLFAFGRKDVFPVDVWMERVYYEFFCNEKRTRPQISTFLTNSLGNLAGYVQQYLFYYKTVKN